ncbi:hypothetical protein [Spongiactinospora sp. 9N601]|uniref:hypothetical protein n=1 Tax=Spongiactinospora sp. 9N601 TaxID=3375149 RepID=UPI003788C669
MSAFPDPSDTGLSALIEWMRQVLIEEPSRQAAHAAGPLAPRLVELVGSQGPGKIALAVQAAARFRPYFPDGQFYVHAEADAHGPDGLVGRLLRVFEIEPARHGTLEEQTGWLRTTLRSRQALLVLDNVKEAAQVRPLLTSGGASAIIVLTPRRLAALEGVWTIDAGDSAPVDACSGVL